MRVTIRRIAVWSVLWLTASLYARPADDNSCPLTPQKVDYCDKCKVIAEKEDIVKGKHKTCDTKVTKTEACVKTYYTCETCKTHARGAGVCKQCQKAMTPKVSKVRILYRCPSCGIVAETAGKCKNENCKGAEMVKTCEMSGSFPHTKRDPAEAPAAKPPKK